MDLHERRIRDGYVAYLRSMAFDPYFRKLQRPPRWRYVLAVPMILSLAGVGIGLGLIASGWWKNRKRKQIRQQLIEAAGRSVPVMAYPVMVNRSLLRQKGAVAPGLVVATFEPGVSTGEMAALVGRMERGGPAEVSAASRRIVQEMFEDENYTPDRRRALPDDVAGGRRVYAFDLMLIGDYLPTDTLRVPLVPCVAEPGESGSIQMIPWWVVAGASEGADLLEDGPTSISKDSRA